MINKALELISRSKLLAFDTETTGLNVRKDKVIGIGLSNEKLESIYIPIYSWNGEELLHLGTDVSPVLEALKSKSIIAHNSYFDLEITRNNLGVDLWDQLHADTIMLIHTAQETGPFGLKQIAKKLWGLDELKEQEEMAASIKANGGSGKGEIYKADTILIGKYCEQDCKLTMKLYHHYVPILKKENLADFFFADEVMPLYTKVTRTMQSRGIKLDVPLLKETQVSINKDIGSLEVSIQAEIAEYVESDFTDWLFNKDYPPRRTGDFSQVLVRLAGVPVSKTKGGKFSLTEKSLSPYKENKFISFILGGPYLTQEEVRNVQNILWTENAEGSKFNLSSKHHLKKLFFEYLRETPTSTTDLGNPQVDDEFLTLMAQKYSWVATLQEYNKLIKIRGTYIDRFLEEQEDGIFYPDFKQHGTISGRYSGDTQQLNRPREDDGSLSTKYSNMIRKFFIAGDGYKFIDSDYCLHPNCELLTSLGWKKILEISKEDLVWQIDPITTEGLWCKPSRVIKKEYSGYMYRFGNRRGTFDVTENHSMLWVGQNSNCSSRGVPKVQKNMRWYSKSQEGVPNTACNILTVSKTDNTHSDYSIKDIWMATMLSADGYLISNRESYYKVEVSVPKKLTKIRELIGREPNEVSTTLRYKQKLLPSTWYIKYSSNLLSGKKVNVDLIGSNQIEDFVEALCFWDGSDNGHKDYIWGSIDKDLVEKVQVKLVSNGYEARLSIREYENTNFSTFYSLHIIKKGTIRVRKEDAKKYYYSGMVGCVTVDTGYILIRNNGQTFVTGNCSLEPHVFAHVSGDEGLKDIFRHGHDFYSTIAIKTEKLKGYSADIESPDYLGKKNKAIRQKAKGYSLGIPYGLSPYALAFHINVSQEEAEHLHRGYFDAFPDLKKWYDSSAELVKKHGYIKSEAGRIRHMPEVLDIIKRYGDWILDPLKLYEQYKNTNSYDQMKEIRGRLKNYMNNARNFQIQSLSASIVNRAAIAIQTYIDENGLDAYICANVHDQLILRSNESQVEVLKHKLKEVMENTYKLSIDLHAPPAIGNNFFDAH